MAYNFSPVNNVIAVTSPWESRAVEGAGLQPRVRIPPSPIPWVNAEIVLKITDVTYLNPKFALSKQTANVMTGNGLLKVFELNPSGGGPSFIGRWDGGSRDPGKTERYDLDIDIYRVSRQEKRRFKKGELTCLSRQQNSLGCSACWPCASSSALPNDCKPMGD